jgi:predicted alpha/beta-fold hydrolase
MSKSSKILMAVATGVAIGAVLAYTVKKINEEKVDDLAINTTSEPTTLENIAEQFSNKISSELKAAELKIRSSVRKEMDALNPEKDLGLFL